MSAAERIKPTRRQRRRDALLMLMTAFANQLADVLDEHDLAVDEGEPAAKTRRAPTRAPYVPAQTPSNDALARAEAVLRRRGG